MIDEKKPDEGNAPAEELETKVKELEDKLNNQNQSTKRLAESKSAIEQELIKSQERIAELENAKKEPKEDSTRIAELELRLARSEAVAEYGLDAEDVSMFKGTPEDIKQQAAHFAAKFNNKKPTEDPDKKEDPPKDPPPSDPPKPKSKELTPWQKYLRATPEEKRKMREKAMAGELDLKKGFNK